jgi:hypothetical protein
MTWFQAPSKLADPQVDRALRAIGEHPRLERDGLSRGFDGVVDRDEPDGAR